MPERQRLLDWYRDIAGQENEYPDEEDVVKLRMLARLQQETLTKPAAKVRRLYLRIAAAASVILVLSVGGYFILHRSQISNLESQISKNDIPPNSGAGMQRKGLPPGVPVNYHAISPGHAPGLFCFSKRQMLSKPKRTA